MKQKLIAGVLGAALGCSGLAMAQDAKYPTKPIRMIVGYAPGGGSDIMGRLIAPQITEALGQQVIVENRAGQAQNIAAEFIIRQPADGYTLFLSSAALGVNVSLYPKLNYDPVKDFVPIAVFSTSANLHGGPSPVALADVPEEILEAAGAVVDGGALPGLPSTVIDFSGPAPRVLREGAAPSADAIARALAAVAG